MTNLTDISKQFKQMTIDTNDVNILLLGETGVGKSTFINAFANYMEYDKFEVAEKSTVRCLIPSSFSVIDENMQARLVKIGRDENENVEVGESATQGVRSYVFSLPKYEKRIRLIDTPGVGDTRGIDQDSINFENILGYIGNMEYLHAICFLLKPNNSRLTVYFEYCIKQLLSRLEKSASKNIIFLFTNSRSTFYRPGDTASALKKILDQIRNSPPNVNIKFEKDNVFCLDNEAFRFMVSYKEGIKFTENDKMSFSRSWDQSVTECWRMINFITGRGDSTVKLEPHKVQDTISVNNARRIIIQLSKPLADIAELINDNINIMQRHKTTLTKENLSMTDLKKRLYVPVVNLRHKELNKPTTVCTNACCSEIYMVAGKKKYHYNQRCHEPCYLSNVPADIIGSSLLVECYAMLPTKKCRECSCDFSSHMHIYYMTETYEDKITDTEVQSQITDHETAIREAQKLITKIELRKQAYEKEKDVIVKNTAKFAHFLQHNAIAPYNDAYKSYMKYLIDRENSYGMNADTQLIINYQGLLKQYEAEKQILNNALQLKIDGCTSAVSSDEVFKAVEDLFKLKNMGGKIKELFEKQTSVGKAEYEGNTEYVMDAFQLRNINPSIGGINIKKSQKKKFQKGNTNDDSKMEDCFASIEDGRNIRNQKRGGYNKNFGKSGNQQWNSQLNKNQGQQNNPNKQQNYNSRGRGQYHNQGRGNYNRKQNYGNDGYNQGSGPFNERQGPHNQKPWTQNPNQDHNQGSGGYNQGPGGHNQGPRGYNQGPGNHNQGSGGYSQGPEGYNRGSGGYNQGAVGYNQGPGGPNRDTGVYNQGPRGYSQVSGPYNQGPGDYNQGSGGYNQGPGNHNQGPGGYNQRQQFYNNQGPPGYPPRDYGQGNSNYNPIQFNKQGPCDYIPDQLHGPNLYKAGNDEKPQQFQVKQNNLDRPSGPYRADVNEKTVEMRHMDRFLNDCETARDDHEDVDVDFEDFMRRHGLDRDNQNAGGYEKNQRGDSGRGRRGRYRGGGRDGNRRSKSSNKFAGGDADSDSGHSYSSRGTNKSDYGRYKTAEKFEFLKLDDGQNGPLRGGRSQKEDSGKKKGILDFFKGVL